MAFRDLKPVIAHWDYADHDRFCPDHRTQQSRIGGFGAIDSSQGVYGLSITTQQSLLFRKEQQ
jgi:hypothetical protein